MAKRTSNAVLEARQHANLIRKEEAQRLRRRRVWIQLVIIGTSVIVVAAIVIGIFFATRSTPVAIPTGSAEVTVGGVAGVPLEIGGDSVRVGSVGAHVTVALYEDFSCPHCQDFEATAGPVIEELIASGDVVLEFHPLRVVTNYGNRAGSASACVAEGTPDQWMAVRSGLFAVHDATTDSWRGSDFRNYLAREITDESVLSCVEDGRYEKWIDENTDSAAAAGVNSTPTVFINGEEVQVTSGEQLRAAVEQVLNAP